MVKQKASTYQPIPSVWNRSDAELLEAMLTFYPARKPTRILDATINAGRFWKDSKRKVTGLDINPRFKPDFVGDNRDMPFRAASFDVVVYDPPHVPNQGRDKSKNFSKRFGLGQKSRARTGYNLTHLYEPFCREAFRVLRPQGVLFCKIADYIHQHRYQWAHIELTNAAVEAGFCACDCIVKVRPSAIVDPKWKIAHHARKFHCYWLVFRKSHRCERKAVS